jgi:hypothetical protein
VHGSLCIAAQIKIMGKPLLLFTGLWSDIYVIFLQLTSEKYNTVFWKKKEFEELEYLVFLDFIL